ADISHGFRAADGSQRSFIEIMELFTWLAAEGSPDLACGEFAHLDGRRRYTRNKSSILHFGRGEITYDEYLRMVRYAQISADQDAPCPVSLCGQHLSQWGSGNTGAPKND